jgi:hypothetical protein
MHDRQYERPAGTFNLGDGDDARAQHCLGRHPDRRCSTLVAWGAMAAALPDHLLGPGGSPILAAVYCHCAAKSRNKIAS